MPVQPLWAGRMDPPRMLDVQPEPGILGAARVGLQRPCCPPWALPARVFAGPPGLLSGDACRAGPGVPLRWPQQLAAEQVAYQ